MSHSHLRTWLCTPVVGIPGLCISGTCLLGPSNMYSPSSADLQGHSSQSHLSQSVPTHRPLPNHTLTHCTKGRCRGWQAAGRHAVSFQPLRSSYLLCISWHFPKSGFRLRSLSYKMGVIPLCLRAVRGSSETDNKCQVLHSKRDLELLYACSQICGQRMTAILCTHALYMSYAGGG